MRRKLVLTPIDNEAVNDGIVEAVVAGRVV